MPLHHVQERGGRLHGRGALLVDIGMAGEDACRLQGLDGIAKHSLGVVRPVVSRGRLLACAVEMASMFPGSRLGFKASCARLAAMLPTMNRFRAMASWRGDLMRGLTGLCMVDMRLSAIEARGSPWEVSHGSRKMGDGSLALFTRMPLLTPSRSLNVSSICSNGDAPRMSDEAGIGLQAAQLFRAVLPRWWWRRRRDRAGLWSCRLAHCLDGLPVNVGPLLDHLAKDAEVEASGSGVLGRQPVWPVTVVRPAGSPEALGLLGDLDVGELGVALRS